MLPDCSPGEKRTPAEATGYVSRLPSLVIETAMQLTDVLAETRIGTEGHGEREKSDLLS